jgi:hypothetical protein
MMEEIRFWQGPHGFTSQETVPFKLDTVGLKSEGYSTSFLNREMLLIVETPH